jgi:hypothetical protein
MPINGRWNLIQRLKGKRNKRGKRVRIISKGRKETVYWNTSFVIQLTILL